MDILWTPWRQNYITRSRQEPEACCFCLPPDHLGIDRPRLVLYSDATILVIMNLYPYNTGHLLVAPRRHIATLAETTTEERLSLMNKVALSTEILTKVLSPGGFNMGINQGRVSGGSVEQHLHFHITPRYQGDANYMTIFGKTKVISQDLFKSFDQLVGLFNGQ